tara:strand:+ start:256 stop:471 length:216 start_codon:yes stop_codon:yes gene_type:complete
MTNNKLKFFGSTISKILRYFNKNVIQARLITFAIFVAIITLSISTGVAIVLFAGNMSLYQFLVIVNKIIGL